MRNFEFYSPVTETKESLKAKKDEEEIILEEQSKDVKEKYFNMRRGFKVLKKEKEKLTGSLFINIILNYRMIRKYFIFESLTRARKIKNF